jgi:drug/metabolite transporter (DMT)-like permease
LVVFISVLFAVTEVIGFDDRGSTAYTIGHGCLAVSAVCVMFYALFTSKNEHTAELLAALCTFFYGWDALDVAKRLHSMWAYGCAFALLVVVVPLAYLAVSDTLKQHNPFRKTAKR